MEIYLVGGAVRDELLHLPIKERDWVVVNGSPKELINQGFKSVGNDFPVFLHPKTKEEYALARTERKTGKGYQGFNCYFAPGVTLEEDLKRRDLTINAMAKTKDGVIIDPFSGTQDLKNKILRHISPAFAEDPVRILRVARFATKFSEFSLAKETYDLMKQMVADGEVAILIPERVSQELIRSLKEPAPQRFFVVLQNCNALKVIFPELTNLKNLEPLATAASLTTDETIRFAVFLNASLAEEENAEKATTSIKAFCRRLRLPVKFAETAVLLKAYYKACSKITSLPADEILNILLRLDAFRRHARFEYFLNACEIMAITKQGSRASEIFSQTTFLRQAYEKCAALDIKNLIANTAKENIPLVIHNARFEVIKNLLANAQFLNNRR